MVKQMGSWSSTGRTTAARGDTANRVGVVELEIDERGKIGGVVEAGEETELTIGIFAGRRRRRRHGLCYWRRNNGGGLFYAAVVYSIH